MIIMFYSCCLVSAITSIITFIFRSLNIGVFKVIFNFFFISELMEQSEESEELSEVEEEHHDKPAEKPLSSSKTKNKFLRKKSQDIFHLHSVWKEFHKQTQS